MKTILPAYCDMRQCVYEIHSKCSNDFLAMTINSINQQV